MRVSQRAGERIVSERAAHGALRVARRGGRGVAPRAALRPLLRALASDCHSVLDVGTGQMRSLQQVSCPVKLGLDAHRPYLEQRLVCDAVPIHASALELERLFVPGAVDLVQLIDAIEHFDPDDADVVLEQAGRVAARRVVVFTPRGRFPQHDFDATGLGGEEYQRHRSTWEPDDLESRGFRVIVMRAFHGPWNKAFVAAFGTSAPPVDALLAFREPPWRPRRSVRAGI